jgi:5'-deoxynucleotidase YfbR-like HD superfamily hydrolase
MTIKHTKYSVQLKNGFFDFNDPENSDITLDNIVESLSCIKRFNGHSNIKWSVLQHSVLVYELSRYYNESKNLQIHCLVHDFHEAFVSDIPSPFKRYLKDVHNIDINPYCNQYDKYIYDKIFKDSLPLPTKEEKEIIKKYDNLALEIERRMCFDETHDWNNDIEVSQKLYDLFDLCTKEEYSESVTRLTLLYC